eukprot:1259024-Pyramimonas_sp.AAC.3
MMGELNFRVIRLLDKVLTVNSTVIMSSPGIKQALSSVSRFVALCCRASLLIRDRLGQSGRAKWRPANPGHGGQAAAQVGGGDRRHKGGKRSHNRG